MFSTHKDTRTVFSAKIKPESHEIHSVSNKQSLYILGRSGSFRVRVGQSSLLMHSRDSRSELKINWKKISTRASYISFESAKRAV